ncbi:MAG: beta-1,4-glucuronosyltransferase WelK [Caulobacteraceae bacterium]
MSPSLATPARPADRRARSAKICLAASGGGHVRQLLDLEAAWADIDHFFVTEDTPLGRSIAHKHRTFFVAHAALGQAKLGAPWRLARAGARNFFQSARIILAERPDLLITTGAGSVFFALLWARILGAKIIAIESFARFERPSAFVRLAFPLAHLQVVQSAALARFWPRAEVFDPLRRIEGPRPAKETLLFATVGATLPFDRLVRMVAEAKAAGAIPERVLAQVGEGGARPEGLECVETLPYEEMMAHLRAADLVVCHGGTGSLVTALREGCRVIAVPRRFARGEHYDDHQAEITRAFAEKGLIGVAETQEDLTSALAKARARAPVQATTDAAALARRIGELVEKWRSGAKAAGVS